MIDFEYLRSIAAEKMLHKRSYAFAINGNKYDHGQNVAKIAVELRGRLFPDKGEWDDVLTVAGWFHDIRNGEKDHTWLGAQYTRELLSGHLPAEMLDRVTEIIAVHDDRKPGCNDYNDCIKLIQDADVLDHLGSYNVLANVLIAYCDDMTLDQLADAMLERIDDPVMKREKLNYELSARIYDEKQAYFAQFAERFKKESEGKLFV